MRWKPTLIVGTGKCGTGYISKFLTEYGIPCGHESVFNPSMLDFRKWNPNKKVESAWPAVYYLKQVRDHYKGIRIINIARNPLDVIKSLHRVGHWTREEPYRKWSEKQYLYNKAYMASLPNDIARAAAWYVLLTSTAFKYADATYKIELLTETDRMVLLLEKMGVDEINRDRIESIVSKIPKTYNSKMNRNKDKPLGWDRLSKLVPSELFYKVLGWADKYGYIEEVKIKNKIL